MIESGRRPLVLASESTYKAALLRRLGVEFVAVPHHVDESVDIVGETLAEKTVRLAEAKASSVVDDNPDAVIIGCDQLAELDGVALGKPGTAGRARAQLATLSGRAHHLVTSLAVLAGGQTTTHTTVVRMVMRTLTGDEIARYVELDEPIDCAGSYKIECGGIALFESIDTGDVTAIEGLPLMAVARMLRDHGFHIP